MLAIIPALILASGVSIGAVTAPQTETKSFEEMNNDKYTIVVSDISELNH